MEIERKFLINPAKLPTDLSQYDHVSIEQAYVLTNPVLRIRKKEDAYILTYKGPGLMKREEVEFPLSEEAYQKLLAKTDGVLLKKTRYQIPETGGFTIELDVFDGIYKGLFLAEVEFPDEETARQYQEPEWFDKEVTYTNQFHNSTLSQLSSDAANELMVKVTAYFSK